MEVWLVTEQWERLIPVPNKSSEVPPGLWAGRYVIDLPRLLMYPQSLALTNSDVLAEYFLPFPELEL